MISSRRRPHLDPALGMVETALGQLVERHGDELPEADRLWLSQLLIDVGRGIPLTAGQLAELSAVRAEIARDYRRNRFACRRDGPGDAA